VPPPAPNTVARPTTLGACQVLLQESMLFVRITWRANFCARKFISFEAFEHEKIPNDVDVSVARARAKPAAARSSASSQPAGRSSPPSRTSGVVRRPFDLDMRTAPFDELIDEDRMAARDAQVKVRLATS